MTRTKDERKSEGNRYEISGRVTYADDGYPAEGLEVTALDADHLFDDRLGSTRTDEDGRYEIEYDASGFRDLFERAPDVYLEVRDDHDCVLASTEDAVVRDAGPDQTIDVQVPGRGKGEVPTPPSEATIEVGGTPVDRRTFKALDSEMVLRIASAALAGEDDGEAIETLAKLNPTLTPEVMEVNLCFTPLLRFLNETVRIKEWDRDVRLRLEEIIIGYDPDASYATHECPNFEITYQTSGSNAVPSDDSGGNITMPGTGTVVGSTTGGNGVPDYVEKLCFWLENALDTYTNPPFDLRNPAASGKIPVNVSGTSAGSAGGGSMTIGRSLNDDLLAAVPTHELMHLIQELYETNGTSGGWNPGMVEGGAVLGEDVVFDTHNRYIVQASVDEFELGPNPGTIRAPELSLNDAGQRYQLALFLKYISEQQSGRVHAGDEPAIGVETYRALLEQFDADGYTDAAFATAVGSLPWYQRFDDFGYLDPARQDRTSAETLLGNFWLACYLKDFGVESPDRRFDFMEDEENATWDSIFTGSDPVSTLGAVDVATTTTLAAGGTLTLSSGASSVSPFAARFYKVDVDSAVDTLHVDFEALSGFDRPLVQLVLVEAGDQVRDIVRLDRTTISRTIANEFDSTDLDHVMIVVAGTDDGGSFTLSVQEVPQAPDVTITRWHHVEGTHYEIDPFGWSWTWVSPDIWVDNDGDGNADDEVYFDQNNDLFVRLHNQGHAQATDVSVDLWYQDASGGLSPTAWQPVRNVAGDVQQLTGLTLAAETTDKWSVDWAPQPSGASKHFCVRAVVTSPGDPNVDNKRCLSNFGNVIAAGPYVDLSLVRRLSRRIDSIEPVIDVEVIPRAHGRWMVSGSDLAHARSLTLEPGKEVIDTFRFRRLTDLERSEGHVEATPEFLAERACPVAHRLTTARTRPDAVGHYPTDSRALPPGLDETPMITIAHLEDGVPAGGFTWAIREEDEERQ